MSLSLVDELGHLSASELERRLRAGEISPVEVVEASLARVDRYGGLINAVVTLNERAVEDARALEEALSRGEEPGPLFGLPVGIKDVTPVRGLRTTFGSRMYADHVPEEDAVVVSRLRKAGAVILGKTNCPEFAAGGNTFNEVFGRTRNPWNTDRSAGGSTGGGAAALATGMIALAEGTDLGGSLRIPASFCGVVGLRPTPGLVPTYPSHFMWDGLQVTGPMGRTAEDVAMMLQAVAGPSRRSPVGRPARGRDFVGAVRDASAQGLRIAYCPDLVGIGIDPAIEAQCRAAALALEESGARVDEVEIDLSEGREAFLHLRGYWMVAHQFPHLDRLDELGDNVAGNVRAGLEVTTRQYAWAEQVRGRIWDYFVGFFDSYDYLVTPAMAVSPFPVEQSYPETVAGRPMKTYVDWMSPTFVLSLTGLPVGSAPCGLDAEGLPVGLQIVGPPSGEEAVLALSRMVHERHPLGEPPLAVGGS